jgi:hypothetical protein
LLVKRQWRRLIARQPTWVSPGAEDGLAPGFYLHAGRLEAMEATNNSLQAAALEQRMRQVDADWEALARSIQADKQRLLCLQEHLDNLRLLLSLPLDEPPAEAPAMLAQIARLEEQSTLLRERITTQDARRNAIEQQFEQARLAWVALCCLPPKRGLRRAQFRKRVAIWLGRSLSRFWALLECSAGSSGVIPDDLWLRRHASAGGQ